MEVEDLTTMTLSDLAEYTKMREGPDGLLELRFDTGEEDEMYVVIACGDSAVLVGQALDELLSEDEDV